MHTFSTSIEIAAPPADVWRVVSDVERWHEWTASITRVRWLDGRPAGVGRTARVTQPKIAPGNFVVTVWEPDRRFDWVAKHPGVTGTARHVIDPIHGGSRVTLSVTFSGLLSRVVVWLYGGLTEEYLRMEAAGLKGRVEAARSVPE